MAGRSRREEGEPLVVRAGRDQERHRAQVTSYGFLTPRRPRRSVTVTPAPLRYWQYNPVRGYVVGLAAVLLAAWLGFLGWRDGAGAVRDEIPLAVVLAVVVLLFSTGRLTVTDVGLSTDIAGLRQSSSFGVVPLALVQEVVRGRPPQGWPKARRRGGAWPGRTRMSVRHLGPDGLTEKAFTVVVRDPDAFADALGRPLPAL